MADEDSKSRVESVMGGGEKKKKSKKKKSSSKKSSKSGKKPHKMHISRTANGKYNVEHEFEQPTDGSPAQPNETHGIENMDELQQHVAENMGPQEEEQASGAAPGGGGGAPSPSPMMG